MLRIIAFISLTLGLSAWVGLASAEQEGAQPSPARAEAAPTAPEAAPAPPAESEATPDAARQDGTPAPRSDEVKLQDDVPARYVVKKGDTLWEISSRFLKNPWKWPDLWGVNKEVVHNPHWIYPGDVLVLDLTGATPRLRLEGAPDGGLSRWSGYELQVTNLTPQMRSSAVAPLAIPTISAKTLDPFLMRPLIVNPSQVASAPQIVANVDSRVIISTGDTAYVTGLDQRKGIQVASAIQEISKGDRLTVAPPVQSAPYVPHAPSTQIVGRVIAGSDQTVSEMGTYSVVILNRGARDGLEVGNVLGLFRSEGKLAVSATQSLQLPEQRYGLIMVFRVFERMSYGLVMTSSRPVNVLDTIRNP
jgi:hypothetical protein